MRLCISPSRRTYTTYWPFGATAAPAMSARTAKAPINLPLCFFASPRTMAALPDPLEEILADEPELDGGDGGAATAAEFAPDDPAATVGPLAELKFSALLSCVLLEPESRCRRRRS